MFIEAAILNRQMDATFLRCDFLEKSVETEKDRALDAVATSRTIRNALSLIDL